tara:strand:+ start:436 stop:1230 length:795 start_codon:yes stop_codon:yes gene_type:complete
MAVVETKYIAAGSYYNAVGYISSTLPGTVSETSGGSQDNNLTDLYSSSTVQGFYHNGSNLYLYITDVSSNVTNSGWDFVKIGTASFNRTDAVYTQDYVTGNDRWQWNSVSQPFTNGTTYAISFETTSSGGGGGGGDYGFEQLDSAGNIVVDSREATETFQEIASALSITLLPPNVGTSTYDWTECLGVTSQQDLDDNYVFERTDGGGWTLFVTENNHTTTYISPGTIRFAWNGQCRNFAGNPTTCTAFHATTNVFTVLAIGKTL